MNEMGLRPMPKIKGVCHSCFPTWGAQEAARLDPLLVSPNGVIHEGCDDGETWCGRDAKGESWWWRA